MSWKLEGTTGTTEVKDAVVATLTNNTKDALTASVRVRCAGLDQRVATQPLATVALAANETTTVSLPVAEIPLQGVDVSGVLSLEVDATGAQATALAVPTTKPLYYHYRSDYSSAFFYGEVERGAAYHGGLVAGTGQDPTGRLKTNGSWNDVAALRAADAAASRAGSKVASTTAVAGSISPDVVMGATRGSALTANPDGSFAAIDASPREFTAAPQGAVPDSIPIYAHSYGDVCFSWTVQYIDNGYGEDYQTTKGQYTTPSSYSYAQVFDPGAGSGFSWGGYLDVNGCTPQLFMPRGVNLQATLTTVEQSGSRTVSVQYHSGAPGDADDVPFPYNSIEADVMYFTISTGAPNLLLAPVQVTSTTLAPYTRVAAEAGFILQRLGTDIPAGTATVYSNTGCGGDYKGVSCGGGDANIFIGYELTPANDFHSYDDSYWKFSFSHEFGHYMQTYTSGIPGTSDYTDYSSNLVCRCDDVYNPANRAHCMQSREYVSEAQAEAYAHFTSAKTWNNTTQSNCTFSYYKEFYYYVLLNPQLHTYGWRSATPPNAVDCTVKQKWMENECLRNGSGVEWDWMNFYWNVTTSGTSKISTTELNTAYSDACAPGSCANKTVSWSSLTAGASTAFGFGSAKYNNFTAQGVNYGVDH